MTPMVRRKWAIPMIRRKWATPMAMFIEQSRRETPRETWFVRWMVKQ